MTIKGVGITMLGVLYGIATNVLACSDEDVKRFPNAEGAISQWENKNGAMITTDARAQILRDFCVDAKAAAKDRKKSEGDVDAIAERILGEYLDRTANKNREGRSLGAITRSALGAAGFSAPYVKKYGSLVFKYSKTVDAVTIGADTYGPIRSLLLVVGKKKVIAKSGNDVECEVTVDILINQEATFNC